MKINVEIEVPRDFEAGDCMECPLAYCDDGHACGSEYVCVLGCRWSECPLVVDVENDKEEAYGAV